jgi:hypothetical protein
MHACTHVFIFKPQQIESCAFFICNDHYYFWDYLVYITYLFYYYIAYVLRNKAYKYACRALCKIIVNEIYIGEKIL